MNHERERSENDKAAAADRIARTASCFWATDHPNPATMDFAGMRNPVPPTTSEIVEGMRRNLKQAQIMLERALTRDARYVAERAATNIDLDLVEAVKVQVYAQLKQDIQRARAEVSHWRHECDWWSARAANERAAGTPVCNPKPVEVSDDELPF